MLGLSKSTMRSARSARHQRRGARFAALALATVLAAPMSEAKLPGQDAPAAAAAAKGEAVVAKTRFGSVSGTRDGVLAVYKGIPFAQPPVGELRWRPPLAPLPWKGVRPATEFARACTQTPNPIMNVPSQPVSEDCLYLNVWTPAKKPGDRVPVIVWIHGGGFSFGSTAMPLFDGAALARKGVVFISVAYRLGPFGFLAHPELSAESPHHVSGNYALLDQIAALQWVKDNVAAFGGDPGRVTIMGESAGAIAVTLLAQSPQARGLFHGVIAESGANFGPAGTAIKRLPEAEAAGQELAKAAGAATLRDLRAMPADAVLRATPPGASPFTLASSWPIVDGYVVPDDPVALYKSRRFNDTPVLMGHNAEEGGLFVPGRTAPAFKAEVDKRFGDAAPRLYTLYPAGDDAEATASAIALMGDVTFGLNHYVWSKMQSQFGKGKLFYYNFAHNPPARPGTRGGAVHGAELPYVFDNLQVRPLAWSDADRATADLMSTYWTNFAKSGDPNGAGLPAWPRYTVAQPQVLYFRESRPEPGPVPNLERIHLLESIIYGSNVP